MGYIIVIARLPGIYGNVNHSCPRAAPSDSGRFTAINPWSRAITITYTTKVYNCNCYIISLLYCNTCIRANQISGGGGGGGGQKPPPPPLPNNKTLSLLKTKCGFQRFPFLLYAFTYNLYYIKLSCRFQG